MTESTTLYARWTGNQVNYTVIYWKENADWENPYLDAADWDKEQYSYMKSETMTGTAGTEPVVSAGSAPQGFKVGKTDTRVIAGDGSTIVNVYYDRLEYEVKFYEKSWGKWQEQTQYTIKAKHGANIRSKWPGGTWGVDKNQNSMQAALYEMPLGGKKFYGQNSGNAVGYYYVEPVPGATVSAKGTTDQYGASYEWHHEDRTNFTTTDGSDDYPIPGFDFHHKEKGAWGGYNGTKFFYTRNSYDIVYIDGADKHTVPKKYQEPIGDYIPTKDGAEFDHWCLDQELTRDATATLSGTTPIGGVTVYAKWKTNDKTVNVYASVTATNGGQLTVVKGTTVTDAELKALLPGGSDSEFLGWYVKDGDSYTAVQVPYVVNEDVNLYALWKTDTFGVTYAGITGAPEDNTRYALNAGAKVMMPTATEMANGETFDHWSAAARRTNPAISLRLPATCT